MFNILDFIDSKCVREYNKDTPFTPIEQAVLIIYSEGTSVEEKMAAWRDLLDAYHEEEFEMTRFGKRRFHDKTNRKILEDTLTEWENALSLKTACSNMVFEASFYESAIPDSTNPVYFADFESAFSYLKEEEQEYLDDDNLQKVQTQAKIRAKSLGTHSQDDTIFYFDNDLRMIRISPGITAAVTDWYDLEEIFIHIPLPFQKGDILRSIGSGETEYGILSETPDETYFERAIQRGDASDMTFRLDIFEDDGQMGYFTHSHAFPLSYEKCPDDQLPDKYSIYYPLRDVHTGKMQFWDFLNLYTYYGKDMYWKVFGQHKKKST